MRHRYRFVYFDVRGAGELCRLTLALSGAKWTDVRYPMAVASSGFSYGPEFRRDAEAGAFDINMASLPMLQVIVNSPSPAVVANLGQSHSISKFVARQHGFAGRDVFEEAKVDALYECCRDIKAAWYSAKRSKQSGRAAWFQKGREQAMEPSPVLSLAEHCLRLERAVAASHPAAIKPDGSPWCVGSPEPTLADVAIYHLLGTPPPSPITGAVPSFFDGESDRVRDAFAHLPRLQAIVNAFGELPTIQAWESKRPDTFT